MSVFTISACGGRSATQAIEDPAFAKPIYFFPADNMCKPADALETIAE
jgi:hypothetical protein